MKTSTKVLKKKKKIEVDIKLLQRIAEYYEFPFAVFFGNLEVFGNKNKTRNEALNRRAEAFDKIKEIVDEVKL